MRHANPHNERHVRASLCTSIARRRPSVPKTAERSTSPESPPTSYAKPEIVRCPRLCRRPQILVLAPHASRSRRTYRSLEHVPEGRPRQHPDHRPRDQIAGTCGITMQGQAGTFAGSDAGIMGACEKGNAPHLALGRRGVPPRGSLCRTGFH